MADPAAVPSPSSLEGVSLKTRLTAAGFLFFTVAACFFPGRESFGDLPSHLYNAWLATLIKGHQAPGLVLAGQSTNVLVDKMLEVFLVRFGVALAGKLTLSILAVVFVVGIGAWLRVISGGQSRCMWPVVVMLAHGIVLQSGFLNFYLSTGLCLAAMSLLWRPTALRIVAAIILFIVARSAHPLPILWALGVLIYFRVAEHATARARAAMLVVAAALLFAVRTVAMARFSGTSNTPRLLELSGASQILLHPTSFGLLALLLLLLSIVPLLRSSRDTGPLLSDPIFHVYVVSVLAVLLLPENVSVGQFSSGGYISLRLSFFTAIAGAGLLARHVRSKRFFWSTAAIAVAFFVLLFRDGRAVSEITTALRARTESFEGMPRVTALVRFPQSGMETALAGPLRLPGLRQVRDVLYDDGFGMNIAHIIDAACIGHCISYGNYEPSTYQFRVRALPGNRFAPMQGSVAEQMEQGRYVVQKADLPMYSVYVCGRTAADFCARSLNEGEMNGYPAK